VHQQAEHGEPEQLKTAPSSHDRPPCVEILRTYACRSGRVNTRAPGRRIAIAPMPDRLKVHLEREILLGEKQSAKQRRRENRDERERAKAARTGESPAQDAETVRRREAPDPDAARRAGTDGSIGGDTASGRASS
jgi:hypothetical protein